MFAAQRHLQTALTPLRLMEDEAGLQEVEQRLQWLAAGQLDLPEPPSHMNLDPTRYCFGGR